MIVPGSDGDLRTQGRRLVDWLSGDAFSAWIRAGFDAGSGNSYERLLSLDTADTRATLRTRTQARQLFVLSVAQVLRWSLPRSSTVAARADALNTFIDRHCRQENDDGYVRSLAPDSSVQDKGHDLYDHACFLLADAWRYRAFGVDSAIESAQRNLLFLDTHLAHPDGGWREGDYPHAHRRQNPHMHLFEGLLALYETTGDDDWLARAGEVFTLFTEHFFDADSGVVLEFFDDALRPAPGDAGSTVEPGHGMEWVWLLRWYERLSGTSTAAYADALFTNGLARGQSDSGLLFDEIGADGTVRAGTKRLWHMPELIKAGIVQARAGRGEGERVAARAIEDFFTHFVAAAPRAPYCDQLDANDAVIDASAAASSMYHLTTAALEIVDYLQ